MFCSLVWIHLPENEKTRPPAAIRKQRRRAACPSSASGLCSSVSWGAISFLRPGGTGCSWLLCEGCDRFLTSALEALTEPPLGQLCAVPLALVCVQLAGRAALELLVDRGVVDGEAGRDVGRPVSDQVPRLDLLPVLEGQVAVFSRRSHLRLWGRYKRKNAQPTQLSLCAFNNTGGE